MAITKATTLADVGSAVGDSPTQVLNIGSVDISGQAGIITATTLNAKSTGLSGDPDISINQMNCGGIATFTDEIDSRSGLVVTSGIITATSFSGNVTGVAATFSGNVEVGGTLSYEDVANVDSTGIITSQKAILAQGYGITATNIEVTGVTTFSGSTTLGSLHIKSATPGLRLEDTDASGTPISYIYGSGGSISLQADEASETGNSDIDFRIDGSEKMRIKGSGKIGIGTNVPSSVVSILDATEPDIEFVVVTDDPATSQKMLPDVPVVGSAVSEHKDLYQKNIGWYQYTGGPVGFDYGILNHAKYAIISASTFAFWPIWTNKNLTNVIAPKYWFDWSRSDGWWRPKDGIVNDKSWLYMDMQGDLYESNTCIEHAAVYYDNQS